jgi:hypothetical protein
MDEVVKRLCTVGAQKTAKRALNEGFPITCATCEHLKTAFDTNSDNCGKILTCGGPIFGRAYPDYIGPIKTEHYAKLCLKCGSPEVDYRVYGAINPFGLCFAHRNIFNKVDGPGVKKPIVTSIFIG